MSRDLYAPNFTFVCYAAQYVACSVIVGWMNCTRFILKERVTINQTYSGLKKRWTLKSHKCMDVITSDYKMRTHVAFILKTNISGLFGLKWWTVSIYLIKMKHIGVWKKICACQTYKTSVTVINDAFNQLNWLHLFIKNDIRSRMKWIFMFFSFQLWLFCLVYFFIIMHHENRSHGLKWQ